VKLSQEITIARPPEEVFAFLSDPSNLPAWQGSVSRVIPPAEIAVGSRFTEERSQLGRTFRSTLEISELEPDRLFTITVVEGPVPGMIRHEVDPDGEGARLQLDATAELNRLPRLVRSLVSKRVEAEIAGDLKRLKTLLERRKRTS
jgi:carbon monoxide dehydrogenase subunit G